MKAIIQAGGAGTRLKTITGDLPKPMVPLCRKPILEWQIANLKNNGITDILLIISKNGQAIIDYFGDGSRFGVDISYFKEEEPLGTGGALYYAKGKYDEDFALLFGDLMIDIDWKKFLSFHKEKGSSLTPFAHPNSHPFDSDLILTDKEGKILGIDSKNNVRDYFYHNLTNAGLYICSPEVIDFLDKPEKIDFEKVILRHFIELGKAYAYSSSEYVKDCGTPDRYEAVQADIRSGTVRDKNLSLPQKAIFLDRDGVLNVFGDFVKSPDKLILKDDAAASLKRINASPYLSICVTNQPVVARGDVTFAELEEIHKKLETELGKGGSYLDGLYYCPHHPHKGYEGEIPELKIECDCRKPKIGLLLKAKERFNIDLSSSWMIGDTKRDVQTGLNAGCRTIMITSGDPNPDLYFASAKPDYVVPSLKEAIDIILGKE